MAVSTLIATAGLATSNAYVDVATADQYHLDRPAVGTTWSDANTPSKTAAILFATTLLDSKIEWTGAVVTSTQALLWPRYGMYYRSGFVVSSTVIPTELEEACAEFARQLIAEDRSGDLPAEALGLTEIGLMDSITLKFKESGSLRVIPAAVRTLIPADWGTVRGRTRELLRA